MPLSWVAARPWIGSRGVAIMLRLSTCRGKIATTYGRRIELKGDGFRALKHTCGVRHFFFFLIMVGRVCHLTMR